MKTFEEALLTVHTNRPDWMETEGENQGALQEECVASEEFHRFLGQSSDQVIQAVGVENLSLLIGTLALTFFMSGLRVGIEMEK